MDTKSTDWRAGPNVCRCCLSEGCYKDISTEYFWMGKREVYAEMLSDTLNLTIAYSQSGGPNSHSRLICELCISRLRDASDFRRQVVECEKTFIQHLDTTGSSELEVTVEPIESSVKLEEVKQEKRVSDDDFDDRVDFDDDDDDLDDQPLTTLASKMPKKVSDNLLQLLDTTKPAEKRKSTTKTKASAAKKSKTVKKETVKATASKVAAKEKKKKEQIPSVVRRNAKLLVQNATAYPFKLPESLLACIYCDTPFEEPSAFRRHMATEHDDYKTYQINKIPIKVDCTELACRNCSTLFDTLENVATHLNEKHSCDIDLKVDLGLQPFKFQQGNLSCIICKKKCFSIRALSRHTQTHYVKFTCEACGKSYSTTRSLQYHVKHSHSNERDCSHCKKQFDSTEAKRKHLKESPECWYHRCSICDQRFMLWEGKQKHMVDVHNNSSSLTCVECGEVCANRKKYIKHYQKCHSK